MNKIIKGAEEALAFIRGEGSASRITTFNGGSYMQGKYKPLIQHKYPTGGYIVWNWDTTSWDKVQEPVRVISR